MKEIKGKHLILIGFMGTGKTTVGKVLAQKLFLPLVDTDAAVERQVGSTIPEIFREEGEVFFRQLERKVLLDTLSGTPSVITTGGGIVLRSENVEAMKKEGWVVALTAEQEELFRRLEKDASRPLLIGDMREQIRKLLSDRKDCYRFADLTVDTTGQSVLEVAELISRYYRKYLA